MTKIHLSGLLLVVLLVQFSCVHEPVFIELEEETLDSLDIIINPPIVIAEEDSCDPDSVYFQNQILPIFIGSCAVTGCHDQSSREADIALVSYANIMKGISPENPSGSKYYKVITLVETDDLMPLNPITGVGFRLPSDQIDLIEKWINQGATDNSCEFCDTTEYTYSGRISAIFSTNCATSIGCHSSGSNNGQMTSYDEIKAFVDTGLIMDRVIVKKDMPVSRPLSACDQEVLKKWIDNGAADN